MLSRSTVLLWPSLSGGPMFRRDATPIVTKTIELEQERNSFAHARPVGRLIKLHKDEAIPPKNWMTKSRQ